MDSHPSFPILSPFIEKYPRASPSLFQTYNDIVYAQKWDDVELIDLVKCSRAAIKGRKRDTTEDLYVVPCSLSETVSFAWLQDAFSQLFPNSKGSAEQVENSPATTMNKAAAPPFIYVAITSSDASIVYYKLSHGIVKPSI
ncbi:hypothetical protein D9613_006151 [Agrocybe pediades]|uniref:tRNA-splicing endonuclease subunit Sen15 domain-containing protein n=1 Tax=Agrocybe pediades TaxID=84607 RepID=A0A8H4QTW7_9AGAR|nr:hypothetical protein D9613_006151 [Agrocybe pediades]KAF9565776.1 hypothetical protein CPC08DRAFT_658845 [Agrocybe pediades]